ncbi:MAG: gephyrin-like molybdotransferase Glp [Pseudomonadota bacterium]
MDACAQPGLLPVADAIAKMLIAITPITVVETVPLHQALDRVLAEDIYSKINVPGHHNSAMDGYALRHADANLTSLLRLAGTSLAGHPFQAEINPGECVRIMTGAVLPANADTVIMQEQVTLSDGKLQLNKIPEPGENIRRAGEDIAINSLVLETGKRLTPLDIGLLASLGIFELRVFERVRVAIFSTGDELKPLDQTLRAGEIYDSNRPTLMALLARLNVEVFDIGLIADDPLKISAAFQSAITKADVVISSGGVSVGEADYTKDVLATLGKINFWKVAMKPGKPFAFGLLNSGRDKSGWFFGLPGNPVSAVVTYHQLVLPALRHLAGEKVEPPLTLTVTAQSYFKKQRGRADYQRGSLLNSKDENLVASTGNQSSGVLSSMARANCYILLEQERGAVGKGEKVQVVPFDRFIT